MTALNRIRKSRLLKWTFYTLLSLIGYFIINSLIGTYTKSRFIDFQHEISESSKKQMDKIKNDRIYYNNIDSLIKLKDYQSAIKLSELRIKKFPEDKPYLTRIIASIYNRKNDIDSAIIKYSEAISLTNTYVLAYAERGWVYIKIDSIELAIKDFKFASKFNWDYYSDLGFAQEKKGLLNEAIDSYNKFLEHYPDNIECKYRRDSILRVANTRHLEK